MGKSKSYGYKIVRELNKELAQKGYMIVEGQTNRQYFYERFYGLIPTKGDD
nr:DNA-binding protein [Thomasclavelia ramosa]